MGDQVTSWANDYDIFVPAYIADPFAIWDDLREHCPVAHTEPSIAGTAATANARQVPRKS